MNTIIRYALIFICLFLTSSAIAQSPSVNVDNHYINDSDLYSGEIDTHNVYSTEALINNDDTQAVSSLVVQSEQQIPFDYKKTAEWGKYKSLRAVGWTFLGVGGVALVGGLFEMALEQALSGKHSLAGPIMMASGGVLSVASIPILIIAYNNRNKAKRMSLDVGMSHIASPTFATNTLNVATALSFKLTF